MQSLVALGTNDFSGPIDISSSCFIRNYAGVTPFARKLHRVQFDQPLIYGSQLWINIPHQGDLLTDVYLDFKVPPSDLKNVIDRIEIFYERQIVERVYMEAREIELQLTVPGCKQGFLDSGVFVIPFSFSKHGLPLVAFKGQPVWIRVTAKQDGQEQFSGASLLCNYVYLSETESKWFSKPYDMLITQVRLHEEATPDSIIRTNFLNPCKELYFTKFDTMSILFNNIEQVPQSSWLFYHNLIPLDFHTRVPTGDYGVYTFSIEPEQGNPAGSVNIGLILHQQFKVTGAQAPFRIYAVTYNILRIQDGSARVLFNNLQ
jgi:hypothetical protein